MMLRIRGFSPQDAGSFAPKGGVCRSFTKHARFAGNDVAAPQGVWFHAEALMARTKKITCDDCFFRRNMLCALALEEPCTTFRPDHPEGLRPPEQMRFVFRQERRTQATWAFPTAQEQAARHGIPA
jgi:hypothetical protein